MVWWQEGCVFGCVCVGGGGVLNKVLFEQQGVVGASERHKEQSAAAGLVAEVVCFLGGVRAGALV